jgi:hypothetical protein
MIPVTFNIDYYSGDTYEFTLRPKNRDGSAFDLTGYTAVFTAATSREATADKHVVSAPVIDAIAGTVACVIPDENGNNFDPTITYVYDVQIRKTDGSGTRTYTLITGNINIMEDVSA